MMRTSYMNRPCELGTNQTRNFGAGEDRNLVTDHIGGIAEALGLAGA